VSFFFKFGEKQNQVLRVPVLVVSLLDDFAKKPNNVICSITIQQNKTVIKKIDPQYGPSSKINNLLKKNQISSLLVLSVHM
jgi:hypothetical protein